MTKVPSQSVLKLNPDDFLKEICEAEIFTSFPPNTFVENISVDQQGSLFVTSVEDGSVYKIDETGVKEEYAKVQGKLVGIVLISGQSFLVNGWNEMGLPTIYLLSGKHQITPLLSPQGALFFNGMVALDDNIFLICDSYLGCIWKFDIKANKASVWLSHSLLARVAETHTIPAANGIKVYAQAVFVSNTDKRLLLKIPLEGSNAGTPEIFIDGLNLDDFAIDEVGTIYATTHIYNSVVKITQDKNVTIIGEADQYLTGSTAAAFGKRPDDAHCIYVTTNGGMSLPLPGGVQDGRIIKMKVK